MSAGVLKLQPLTAEDFAPFGCLIDLDDPGSPAVEALSINEGHALKFADLLPFDCDHEGGRVAAHFYRSEARELPLEIHSLERHPLGSQAFWPLRDVAYAVIVAPPGEAPEPGAIRAFRASGRQAIQYHRGTWHHYLVSLDADSEFLVLDREGPGNNCDEVELGEGLVLEG
jgi:ureidoglycolate lyase